MKRHRVMMFTAALAAACRLAYAADIYVICSNGVSVTSADVRDIFVGEKQFAGGVKLVPADNSSLQADFLQKVLKMNSAKYAALWTKKSFRDGVNPPSVKSSDAEILEYVKHAPGACGYISSAPPGGVTLAGKF
jgi:hypothetical protein